MGGQLAAAELVYRWAPFHYALMLFDPFSRGWCLYELISPLSICSVLFALILRFAQTFHKVIVRITATFIIAAILFSCDYAEYNEGPCSLTILIVLMIFSCVVNINAVVGETTAFLFPLQYADGKH